LNRTAANLFNIMHADELTLPDLDEAIFNIYSLTGIIAVGLPLDWRLAEKIVLTA